MIEQNAAATKNAVALAIVHRHPMRVELGHAIRAARAKRRVFHLGNRLHLAKHLRGAGLVEANLGIDQANRLQQVQCANAGDLRRDDGLVEAHAHEALRGQVVDLVWLHFLHQRNAAAQVCQVVFHQMQIRVVLDAQFLNAPEVDGAGAAVGAVLSGDAGD